MASETYEFFKDLANSQEINRWSYPDPLIYDVRHTRGSNSIKVVITFDDDDDFLDVLGVNEDDEDRYIFKRFMSSYYHGDWDRYRYDDDWSEGYTLQNFNQENTELVNEILKYTNPTLRVIEDDYGNLSKISRFLDTRFKDVIDELVYDSAEQREDCIYEGAKQLIMKETDKPFKRFGIVQKSHGYKFETTVNVILKLYRLLNAEDEDLKGLLTKLHEKYPQVSYIGDWENLQYEAWCDDFDENLEQENFKKHLEKILDEIRDNSDEYVIEEFNKLYNKVHELGGFDKWIRIPEKKITIKFISLNEKTNTLHMQIQKPGSGSPIQQRSINNLEDLNLTLYHPELFESVKKTLRKFL
jgi:hypothetical protein